MTNSNSIKILKGKYERKKLKVKNYEKIPTVLHYLYK
jgi:hypothetical protein